MTIIKEEKLFFMEEYIAPTPLKETKKKTPFVGFVLLFLLLVIPVGMYYVIQIQSIGDIRSFADNDWRKKTNVILPDAPAAAAATPTPTPLVTNATRCNKSCSLDTDCSATGDMVCAKVNGIGKCRAASCSDVSDCWCNKTVACNTACTESSQCGTGKICAIINGTGKCRSSECYGIADCMCYVIGGSPTPTPTPAVRCNNTCTLDTDCGGAMICVVTANGNKCRNSQCYGVENCLCYSLLSPTVTPTPTKKIGCNSACTVSADCGGAMICVKTTTGNKCRDPQCYGVEDCLCYSLLSPTVTPTPIEIATPTVTPRPTSRPVTYYPTATKKPTPTPTSPSILLAEGVSPTPILTTLTSLTSSPLTITPFTDANGIAPAKLVISGTAEPDAEIRIIIASDAVAATVYTDTTGAWTYTSPKALSNGNKEVVIVMRPQTGTESTKTEYFIVKTTSSFPWIVIAGIGGGMIFLVGVYVLGQKHGKELSMKKV